jgi:DNA-binding MarR family transcriptional regulator
LWLIVKNTAKPSRKIRANAGNFCNFNSSHFPAFTIIFGEITELMKPEDRMMAILQRMRSMPMMMPSKEFPLSAPQIALVSWVNHSPGCGVLDIAKGLRVTPPTVSVAIRRLVKDGWLEQRSDPDDKRARPIYLTEKGTELADTLKVHRTQMLKLFLSGLNDEEKEQLICLLDRAVSAIESAQTKETP